MSSRSEGGHGAAPSGGAIQSENALNAPDLLKAAVMLAAIAREPSWTLVEPFCGAYVHPGGEAAARALALAQEIEVHDAAPDRELHRILRMWNRRDVPGGLALEESSGLRSGPIRVADADPRVIDTLPSRLRDEARCGRVEQTLGGLLAEQADERGVHLRLDAYNAAGERSVARAQQLGRDALSRVGSFVRVEVLRRAGELLQERSALIQVFAIRDRMVGCTPMLDVIEAIEDCSRTLHPSSARAGVVLLDEPRCWDRRSRRITTIALLGLGGGAELVDHLLSLRWQSSFVARAGLGRVAGLSVEETRELLHAAEQEVLR